MNIYEKLLNIQNELKVPKNQYNKFGNYKYRNAEDILEAVKPICLKYKCLLTLSDEIVVVGEHNPQLYEETYFDKDLKKENKKTLSTGYQRFYVQATATLYDVATKESISSTANAQEEQNKKGMDGSQLTGATSSYARKYALNGLLCIDDTKDTDSKEYQKQTQRQQKNSKTDTTPYDFMSDEDKLNASPILEGQKQQITDKMSKEEIKNKLIELKKKKLSDLTFGQAKSILDELDKKQLQKSREKEEVF